MRRRTPFLCVLVAHVVFLVLCTFPAPKAGASAASKPVSKPAVASKPKPASDAPRRTGGFGGEGAATGEDGEAIKGGDSRGGRGCVTLVLSCSFEGMD